VTNVDDLVDVLEESDSGQYVVIGYYRNNTYQETRVILGETPKPHMD